MVIKLQYSRRYSAASFHYEQIIENLACQYKIGYPFSIQTAVRYAVSEKIAHIYVICKLYFHLGCGVFECLSHSHCFTSVCEPIGRLIWIFTPDLLCLQWSP